MRVIDWSSDGSSSGLDFLGLILVELMKDQRVERVHAVARRLGGGCGAGRGTLVGGYQAGPFLLQSRWRERVIGSRGARPSRRSNQRGSACRIAVADRTSGENRRNTRAGGLQSVQ